jgi:hypothetical protein
VGASRAPIEASRRRASRIRLSVPATSVVAARARRVCLLRSFSTAFVQAGELLANGLATAGVCLSAIGLLLSGVLTADSRSESLY